MLVVIIFVVKFLVNVINTATWTATWLIEDSSRLLGGRVRITAAAMVVVRIAVHSGLMGQDLRPEVAMLLQLLLGWLILRHQLVTTAALMVMIFSSDDDGIRIITIPMTTIDVVASAASVFK